MPTIKLPFYAKLSLTLLMLLLIVFFMMQGSTILIPLVFALLIAVLLYPLANLMQHKLGLGRFPAAAISIIIFIAAIGGFIYFLTLQIINFSQDLPQLQDRVTKIIQQLQHWIATEYHVNSKQQTDYLNKSANGMIATAANSIGNIFLSVLSLAIYTIFTFVFTFFMLYHRKLLVRFVLHLFAPNHRERVNEVITETRSMMNGYVLGLLLEMVILSIINCTAFFIIGIKYALLLGVMAAVLNIIPYLGIYTSMALGMLVTFANSGPNQALTVGIVLIAVHFFDSNIVMPRIVGSRVKMNPLITIIAVLVGHFIWGIPGMFLFIPLTGMFKIVAERVDDLKPWAILIGTDDNVEKVDPRKGKITDTDRPSDRRDVEKPSSEM